jgi:homoserine kinase type II
MAVYTEVSREETQSLFTALGLGEVTDLQGCQGGIENTNYFVDSSAGRFVLTLFERLSHEQLPFYLYLMKHLAQRGIPVPDPQANKDGDILLSVQGKPACVVNRLRGKSELAPSAEHCATVGAMLARMHLAGRDYSRQQPNLRALSWWNETIPVVLPYLDPSQAQLIQSELAYQNHVAASSAYAALPRGPVHADLFRDNVMFEGSELTGFFDFYFAGVDTIGASIWPLARLPTSGKAPFCKPMAACAHWKPPSAAYCQPCCAPEPCAFGPRACGTFTFRARPACSKRMIPRTSSAFCAHAWPTPARLGKTC